MDAADHPPPEPIRIIQPCSEACACFRLLPGHPWTDFGICRNPASPYHGFPVRTGRDCPRYEADPPQREPDPG